MMKYRVYRNKAVAAYLSLYCSFFFLSNFQTLKFFVTLFSGIVRPRRLKLIPTWTMGGCIVYTRIMLSLYFFIFFSLQFSQITIFRHTFLRNCEALKVETWYTCGQWADILCLPESGCCCCIFVPLFLQFPFSSIFKH